MVTPRTALIRTCLTAVAALVMAACVSADVLVVSERADEIPAAAGEEPTAPTDDSDDADSAPGNSDEPVDPIEPPAPQDDADTPDIDMTGVDNQAINFGSDKPPRPYDDFLLAVADDIEKWLSEEFEPAFGIPFEPLQGDIYAGYPERQDPIPGCGEPVTSYEDLTLFVAFYCPLGDFIAYDDGDESLLTRLAEEFGPSTIGIVLAHEYGHALQQRTGALQLGLPTVFTEQQADCVGGAWAARAAAGEASGIPFDDDDVRAGLIAMLTVQDPVGLDPTDTGSHGSGFDRTGAFQVGFIEGLERCAELIDDPLPLTPVEFTSNEDFRNQGNAPFGFEDNELFGFLVPDLNLLFDNDLDATFPDFRPLELVPVESIDEVDCDTPFGLFELGVELCSETDRVYLNLPVALERYSEFGDFAPGYLLGVVWAEHAQVTGGSELRAEERQLRNDCLVGAWVRTVTPDPDTGLLPAPRDPERTASISPNDLTEAIQTVILIGDPTSTTDVLGSAFEKTDAFRRGALEGIEVCIG